MIIRKEKPQDHEMVYVVIKKAFDCAEHADGNEQDLVNELRKGTAFIPDLSLVADINGKLIGHIMFTEATVEGHTVLVLAPLAVLPEYQRQGVGTALIQEGHRIASKLGYDYSVVLGSENYYSRVGYLLAEEWGIMPPFEVPRENFMVCRLNENAPKLSGMIHYAKEFGLA